MVFVELACVQDSSEPPSKRRGGWCRPRLPVGWPVRENGASAQHGGGGRCWLSVCLTIYGVAQFKESAPFVAPSLSLTGRKKEADKLQTAEGWSSFAGDFFFGGLSGVAWAYFLLYVLNLPYFVK